MAAANMLLVVATYYCLASVAVINPVDAVFNCPALGDPGVLERNFTIARSSPIPPLEWTFVCQAFQLNSTEQAVHMIGSRPLIVNSDFVRQISIFACDSKPEQRYFDAPQACYVTSACLELISTWSPGQEGECQDDNGGYLVGSGGIVFGMLRVQWYNPLKLAGQTDASGLSLYFTQPSSMRRYNMGTLLFGEVNLVLPPRQQKIGVTHTCPSQCTSFYQAETRYITAAGMIMNNRSIMGRVSLWRRGSLVKDLIPLRPYSRNHLPFARFNPTVEYLVGDEVKTECYYNTQATDVSTFYGFGRHDELCYSFLSYFPNDLTITPSARLHRCLSESGINLCWIRSGLQPQVEQDCNITAMRSGDMPGQVLADMTANNCFFTTGCNSTCRSYLQNTLWSSNACYDPKRARQMAELMATGKFVEPPVNQTIAMTLFGQRFCEQEVKTLANQGSESIIPIVFLPPTGRSWQGSVSIAISACYSLALIFFAIVITVYVVRLRSAAAYEQVK